MSREELRRAHDDIKTNWLKLNQLKVSTIPTALTALRSELGRVDGCQWCKGDWTDNFTVIDDDFGQPLTYRHVKFCPMCGKALKEATP